jgi:serine O-acetyltransferase
MDLAGMAVAEISVAEAVALQRPAVAGAIDRPAVAGGGGWRGYRADLGRYRAYQQGQSVLSLMLMNQGLWALLQYRFARGVYESDAPSALKKPLLVLCVLWQKLIEVLTGIELPYRARIAPGLYIGHFGAIIIHPDVVIGAGCNLSQGVTLGISGRGNRRGVPTLGERVYVGANAVIAGPVNIGDDALIAANTLITRDVAPRSVMLGNPAQLTSFGGSAEYISPAFEPYPDSP